MKIGSKLYLFRYTLRTCEPVSVTLLFYFWNCFFFKNNINIINVTKAKLRPHNGGTTWSLVPHTSPLYNSTN